MNDKIKSARFHHISLASYRFAETLKFYNDLGFKEVARWGEGESEVVMMDIGDGGIIEIFARGKNEKEEYPRFFHLAIYTDDVDDAFKKAIEAGATPKIEPKDVEIQSNPKMNVRIAFVYGLNGEELEFFHQK